MGPHFGRHGAFKDILQEFLLLEPGQGPEQPNPFLVQVRAFFQLPQCVIGGPVAFLGGQAVYHPSQVWVLLFSITLLGGLLVSALGWRAFFFATIPMALFSIAAVTAVLRSDGPDTRETSGGPSFDWLGAATSSGSMSLASTTPSWPTGLNIKQREHYSSRLRT